MKQFADTRRMQEVHTDGWNPAWRSWSLRTPQPFSDSKMKMQISHIPIQWADGAVPLERDGMGFIGSSPVIKSRRRHTVEAKEKIWKELWLNEFQAPVIFKNSGVTITEPTRAGISVIKG